MTQPSKVLVIDDEEDFQVIARDVLKSAGMEIMVVSDGKEGLAALNDFRADVVLVDWMMPKMDGEQFCKRVRADERFRNLPILMLTVKRTADEELEALHFGASDFIVKPFKPDELIARVRAALRAAQAE